MAIRYIEFDDVRDLQTFIGRNPTLDVPDVPLLEKPEEVKETVTEVPAVKEKEPPNPQKQKKKSSKGYTLWVPEMFVPQPPFTNYSPPEKEMIEAAYRHFWEQNKQVPKNILNELEALTKRSRRSLTMYGCKLRKQWNEEKDIPSKSQVNFPSIFPLSHGSLEAFKHLLQTAYAKKRTLKRFDVQAACLLEEGYEWNDEQWELVCRSFISSHRQICEALGLKYGSIKARQIHGEWVLSCGKDVVRGF